MAHQSAALLSFLLAAAAVCRGANLVTNAVDLARAAYVDKREWVSFDLTGRVTFAPSRGSYTIAIEDSSGAVALHEAAFWPENTLKAGDLVRARGVTCRSAGEPVFAETRQVEILAHKAPPKPMDTTAQGFLEGTCDYRLIRISGTVRNAFRDEIDPQWTFVILGSGPDTVYLTLVSHEEDAAVLKRLIGQSVSAIGLSLPFYNGLRRHIGRTVLITGLDALSASESDPYDVPDISVLRELPRAEIASLGRHRTSGRVIAVWQQRNLLLRTDDGQIVRAALTEDAPPSCGAQVELTGFPETDLYRINLVQCGWRAGHGSPAPVDSPTNVTVSTLLEDRQGRQKINAAFHGRTIRLCGTVTSLPAPGNNDGRLHLKSGKYIVPIDVSARPDALEGVSVGCTLEITGTCVMETDNWNPHSAFPHIRECILVVRTPADVRILAHPPWWTPGRLLAVIGSLLAALVGILIWNVSLRRIATRKGRELFKEQVKHVKADLRTEERTRLAVELHDTLAQNLTGVSMEIEAANDLRGEAPQPMLDHLEIAAKALKSCRDELRNCLWDLRSQALEEQDMTKAVLRTLQPHVNESQLAVRFNAPRSRLSDNTAHALLRAIRELVINAIRHGNASSIKIAGTINQGRLLCSVTDNGSGFDIDAAPGVPQGHFGLQGVRERIAEIGGSFEISSSPGKGTKAVIALTSPIGE